MEQLALLKQFSLFNKLSDQELEKIASRLTEKAYADKEMVCRRGEPGGVLYLIRQGVVSVILPLYRYDKKCQVVSKLGEGMFFGELSFLDGKEYSADIYAEGEVKLLELKRSDYEEVIVANPEKGYDIQNKIILNLIRIIREMNRRYSLNVFLR